MYEMWVFSHSEQYLAGINKHIISPSRKCLISAVNIRLLIAVTFSSLCFPGLLFFLFPHKN